MTSSGYHYMTELISHNFQILIRKTMKCKLLFLIATDPQ